MADRAGEKAFKRLRSWLDNIAGPEDPWCFLVGSGISIASGLPNASAFLSELFKRLVPGDRDTLRLLRGYAAINDRNSHNPEKAAKNAEAGQYLRFEQVMACLNRFAPDEYPNLLRCFAGTCPVVSHKILGNILGLSAPHCVFTTNFDCLIELSRPPSLNRQLAAISENEHKSQSHGFFKLHGTIARVFIDKAGQPQLVQPFQDELPAASIDEIGKIRHSGHRQRRLTRSIKKARIVVVAGYSASDSFDIVPWLASSRPQALLWVDHDPYESNLIACAATDICRNAHKRSLPISTVCKITSGLRPAVRNNIIYVRGNTDKFWPILGELFSKGGPAQQRYIDMCSPPAPHWQDTLFNWAKAISPDQRHLMVAAALLEVGNRKDVSRLMIRHFEKSSSPPRLKPVAPGLTPALNEFYCRVLLENRAHLAGHEKLFTQLCGKLRARIETIWSVAGYRLAAQRLQESHKGKVTGERALKLINAALAKTRKNSNGSRAALLFIKTRILRDAGKNHNATRFAKATFDAAKNEGNIYLEAAALHEIGKNIDRMARSSKEVSRAIACLRKAIDLRRNLAQRKDLMASLNVVAVLYQHLVDFVRLETQYLTSDKINTNLEYAKNYINEALAIVDDLGDEWHRGQIALNQCWLLLKTAPNHSATRKLIDATMMKTTSESRPLTRAHDKFHVLSGYAKLVCGDVNAAERVFRTVKADFVEPIASASATAGLALSTGHEKLMKDAMIKFGQLRYYRGAALCKRLLKRKPFPSFEAYEIPDALL